MKTTNELLQDALIRHEVYLLRYSGHLRNEMLKILNKSEAELSARIGRVGSSGLNTPVEWKRLEALQKALAAIRMGSWQQAIDYMMEQSIALAYQEPIWMSGIVQTLVPVTIETVIPTQRQLRAITTSRPFEGALLKDWASTMARSDIRRINAAVQAGMIAGESMDTIARRVLGTRAFGGVDGVTETARRQVDAITRTAVQHIANSSRRMFFDENADIVTEERFVATLDSRTTVVCASHDGEVFPRGEGPQPPLHFRCRSLRIMALNAEFLGERPAKPVTESEMLDSFTRENGLSPVRNRDGLPRGFKGKYDQFRREEIRRRVGPIAAKTTYSEWLKGQSVAFQNEVLGVTKGKLFRQGGLTLDKFVDLNGGELTLGQLASKHAAAFEAAGINPAMYL